MAITKEGGGDSTFRTRKSLQKKNGRTNSLNFPKFFSFFLCSWSCGLFPGCAVSSSMFSQNIEREFEKFLSIVLLVVQFSCLCSRWHLNKPFFNNSFLISDEIARIHHYKVQVLLCCLFPIRLQYFNFTCGSFS